MERRRRLRLWCKEVAARTLLVAGFSLVNVVAQRVRLGGRRIIAVSYHRVVGNVTAAAEFSIPGLLISADSMRRQLEELARSYEIVPLETALREMAHRRPGSDLAAITFDDGYADLFHEGLGVLRDLRLPATVFLVSAFVGTGRALPHDRLYTALRALEERRMDPVALPPSAGRHWLAVLRRSERGLPEIVDGLIAGLPDDALASLAADIEARTGLSRDDLPPGARLLDWGQVRALARAGLSIGAHTMRHRVLTHLSAADVRWELETARACIREKIGFNALDFAYPNGWYSEGVVRAVEAAGYRSAVTTEARHNGLGEDPFRLGRYTLWEGSTLGPLGYSHPIASCQLDGSFRALGIPRLVSGLVRDDPAPGGPALRLRGRMLNLLSPEGTNA